MKGAGVLVCYLLGAAISCMVIFELFRWNIYPALMWMLILGIYLNAMVVLVDRIEDRGGFDG